MGTRALSVRETQQKTLAQSRGRLTIFIKRLRDLPLQPGNRKSMRTGRYQMSGVTPRADIGERGTDVAE